MTKWFCPVTCLLQDIFIVKKLFYIVVQTSSEICPSLRLLLKVCVWYRCQNRIKKYYRHDGEQVAPAFIPDSFENTS